MQATPEAVPKEGEIVAVSRAVDRRANHRRRMDRGLPSHEHLVKLMTVYAKRAPALWPEAVALGVLPPNMTAMVDRMASDYEARFRSQRIEPFEPPAIGRPLPWRAGAAYVRYSSSKSNPQTLDVQLNVILERAAATGMFIPLQYVFADSSMSGTIAVRRAYLLVKRVMEDIKGPGAAETLYVYDLTRASRDVIESHKLARILRLLRKNLLGVADGFDLNSPQADIQLAAMAMFSNIYITSVRQRVREGMKATAKRGNPTGTPAFGYMLVPASPQTQDAEAENGKQRRVLKKAVVDPDAAEGVKLAFQMVGIEHKSYEKTARKFNDLKIGGKNWWHAIEIMSMVANPVYIGVVIYNKCEHTIDPETGKHGKIRRPRSDWITSVRPELRIISDDLWKAARRRAYEVKAASPDKLRRPGVRAQIHPTTLLSGTLLCAYCARPLTLARGGERGYYWCSRGHRYLNSCPLSCKSVQTVESAVLNHIGSHLLGEQNLQDLVAKANGFLAEEAAKPRTDVAPIRADIQRVRAGVDDLVESIKGHSKDFVQAIVGKIEAGERRIRDLRKALDEAEARNCDLPRPITIEDVRKATTQLREILNQEPAMAAPVLRRLTGPITVFKESRPTHAKPVWVGRFSVNLVPALVENLVRVPSANGSVPHLSSSPEPSNAGPRASGTWTDAAPRTEANSQSAAASTASSICPDSEGVDPQTSRTWTLETPDKQTVRERESDPSGPPAPHFLGAMGLLASRGWSFNMEVEVVLEKIPDYQRLACKILKLRKAGISSKEIAERLHVRVGAIRPACRFAETGSAEGVWATNVPGDLSIVPDVEEHAAKVVEMYEQQGLRFREIAKALDISTRAAVLAYHHARGDTGPLRPKRPMRPKRVPGYVRHAEQVVALMDQGMSCKQVATTLGINISMVWNAHRHLRPLVRDGSK